MSPSEIVTCLNNGCTSVQKLQCLCQILFIFSVAFAEWTDLEWFLLKILPLGNHDFIVAIMLKSDEPNFVSQISYPFVSVILFRYMTWCLTYKTFCTSMSRDVYQEIIDCRRSGRSLYETQFCACRLIRTRPMMAGSSFPHSLCLSIHSVYTVDSCRPWSCTWYLYFLFKAGAWPLGQNSVTPFAVPQELEKSVQMVM